MINEYILGTASRKGFNDNDDESKQESFGNFYGSYRRQINQTELVRHGLHTSTYIIHSIHT